MWTTCSNIYLLLLLFVYLQFCQPSTLDATEQLFTNGFLGTKNPNPELLKMAIKKFQNSVGLGITGTLNKETEDKMFSPRCGRPSNAPMLASARDKWERSHITYKIKNFSEPFTERFIRNTFENAIKSWTDKVNLQITESSSNNGDINVYFTQQDGPYNVLGYAYFPENGDIYFDPAEPWTLKKQLASEKIYFGWVAAHEMGHSLGLSHSEHPQSIMNAYYSSEITEPTDFDIRTLQSLYGVAKSSLCDKNSIDAVLDSDKPKFIRGKQFWRLSSGSVQEGPFSLDDYYPGLPDKIDVAVSVGKRRYFFRKNLFYRYNENGQLERQRSISVGFDGLASDLDAGFYDPDRKFIYFFKGSKYYMLDTTKPRGKRLMLDDKQISDDWDGVPSDIEAATFLKNSRVLLIKKSKCYVVDANSKRVLSSEDCDSTFYNCRN